VSTTPNVEKRDLRAGTNNDENANALCNVQEFRDGAVSFKVERAGFSLCNAPVEVNRHSVEPTGLSPTS
jgi:hypothetical protein